MYRALFTSALGITKAFDVKVKEIGTATMQRIVDYIYTRVADLTEDNIVDMITWAHYFGLETLVDICASFVLRILQAENCISYMLIAK